MTQRANILQELNEIGSSLANAVPQNMYAVPAGYFERFAEKMLMRIKATDAKEELAGLSSVLNTISKKIPYFVPTGYFDGLEEKLMQRIRESADYQTAREELESISPLLSGLKKEVPYSVPQGYFENSNTEESIKPKAKVVSLIHRKWFQYAAAAVVVGVFAMVALLIKKQETVNPNDNPYEWVAKNMKKVSTEKINDFIHSAEMDIKTPVSTLEKPDDLKELMKDVSDKDIQQFLNETAAVQDNDDIISLN